MRMFVRIVGAALLILTVSAAPVSAQPQSPDEAESGHNTEPDYLALAEEVPTDPDRAFNAGLAAARADDIGGALLYLERARAYAPMDREIRDTVALVRREAGRRRAELWSSDKLTQGQPAPLYWWHFFRSLPLMLVVSLLFGASVVAVLLIVLRSRMSAGGRRDAVTVFAALAVFLCINASVWIIAAQRVASRVDPAVIVAATPTWRDAPDDLAAARRGPEVYTGALVLIRESRPGWHRVELADGEKVWMRDDTTTRVLASE